jgi:hypothetical protein
MSFTKAFLLFLSFVISVHALATPHAHHAHHHRALAARLPTPDLPLAPVLKRQNSKRCKPRSSVVSSTRASETSTTISHVILAPEPTTTVESQPTTTPKPYTSTSKEVEAPATTTKSSPPPSSNVPSYLDGTQTGEGTFYSTGLGACGITNHDSDHIAAVSHLLFDSFPEYNGVNPNNNPVCNRKVTATYKGRSVQVTITDRCTGCQITDLDFSPSAFSILTDGDLGIGRLLDVKWVWDY